MICDFMSLENSNKYPLKIENDKLQEDTLEFTIINNTNQECTIYLNNNIITKSNDKKIKIKEDISNTYISKFNIKAETKDKFIYKSINRDLKDYFKNLKKTILGKDNTFFLINDRNEEIRQHYDKNYECNLDINKFRHSTETKKNYLNKKGIKYGLFVVPDKSIILRNKLPFKTDTPERHTDKLKDTLHDLSNVISSNDFYKNDTHISSRSSPKIVAHIISSLHNTSHEIILEQLDECTHFKKDEHLGDLFNIQNWSYDRDEMFHENKYITTDKLELNTPVEKVNLNSIPPVFRHISRRDSYYFRNEHSISDKRAVILHDSTTLVLMDALTAYYKEVFFYWDHWFFNDKLIEWFKPDDVLEIRTERFLDNPQYQIVNDEYIVKFPISAQMKKFNIDENTLNAQILIKDYRQLPVKTIIKTFLDDTLIREEESSELYYNFNYSLNNCDYGEHTLLFKIKSKYKYREVVQDFVYEESLEPLFKDLKHTFKGLNNTFFIVNDNSNEIRQHYDRMYNSKFNQKKFLESLSSKKSYLENMGINYGIYIIPDKSVVLNRFLPFDNPPLRKITSLTEHLVDLIKIIDEEDFLINDTNVSMCAGLKIVAYILNNLHKNKTFKEYYDEMLSKLNIVEDKHRGNLFTKHSWSYPNEIQLHDKYYAIDTKSLTLKEEAREYAEEEIPLEYRMFSTTKSQYYHNNNSISDNKVLVLCDDSVKPLIPALISYYKDVFLYQDLWYFNKDLVEWLEPSDVLEIRGERTLENAQYQLVSIEDNFVIPITRKVEKCILDNNRLSIKIAYYDLRNIPIVSSCKILVDDTVIDKKEINGVLDASYTITDGKHRVKVILDSTSTTKGNVYKQSVGE